MANPATLEREIIDEIYKAFETLGAEPFLLGAVASWRDTLDDGEVLALLKQWNADNEAPKKKKPLRAN